MKISTEDYATKGLNALKRAARKAFERARQNNLEVPIWRDGKIEYINSETATESGKGEFFSPPPHTTQRAGPH